MIPARATVEIIFVYALYVRSLFVTNSLSTNWSFDTFIVLPIFPSPIASTESEIFCGCDSTKMTDYDTWQSPFSGRYASEYFISQLAV